MWFKKSEQVEAAFELGIQSTEMISDIYSLCREVCALKIMKDSHDGDKLGGPGKTVEIDEAKSGKRKYNRGRMMKGVWIFGAIERTDDENSCYKMKACVVGDRTAETLLGIIRQWILPGTTIISDGWASYSGLDNLDDYIHQVVIHDQNFVDPITGAHTNTIEGRWKHLRRHLPPCGLKQTIHYNSYVYEYVYRVKYGMTKVNNNFDLFIKHISEVYDVTRRQSSPLRSSLLENEYYEIPNNFTEWTPGSLTSGLDSD